MEARAGQGMDGIPEESKGQKPALQRASRSLPQKFHLATVIPQLWAWREVVMGQPVSVLLLKV